MTAPKTTLRLSVPPQQLDRLSFCEATPDAFDRWLLDLPMANVDEVAKHLYRAVVEVPQLKCSLDERFAMIEALRAPIHFTCVGLARRYMNQPVLVNETMRRYANQCQVLQNQLAVGYKVVVVQAIQSRVPFGPSTLESEPGAIVPIAIYRTLTELTMTLLRSCQLYTDPLPKAWLELNQLLLVSDRTGISELRLDEHADDEHLGPFTIRDAYLRAALLATASPNKLRQRQLSALFDLLSDWARHVDSVEGVHDGNFIVDLSKDEAPVYAPAYGGERHAFCRTLVTDRLVNLLDSEIVEPGSASGEHGLQVGHAVSRELLAHAANAWGRRSKRAFSRLPSTGRLFVCIGFSATHYHLAEGREFDTLLRKGQVFSTLQRNRFADRKDIFHAPMQGKDTWSNAWDSGGGARMPENPDIEEYAFIEELGAEDAPVTLDLERYPYFETSMVDTSPGGYCIRWKDIPPSNLQTGELLATRETPDQRWALAVVRWMRHVPDSGTLVGLELLAPIALPVGARALNRKDEEPQFMRGLLLPPMTILKQPSMLVLPKISFTEGQRILINQSGSEVRAVLTRIVSSTDAFAQFEFRLIDTGQPTSPEAARRGRGKDADLFEFEP